MLILGKDYETTGLDPTVNSITEVGLVLWETDLHAPVKVMGFLVDPGPDAVWDKCIGDMTGITPELCAKYGYPSERALKQVLSWYQMADVACAHNGAKFDRPFFNNWCKRHNYDSDPAKLWIDTNTDIELPFPEKMSRKLTYMAADHAFLNPFPHRAVFDVMTMLRILDQYDLERVLFLAKQPTVDIQALVSYDDRDLAKQRGYRWQDNPFEPNGKKIWMQTIKQCFLEKEMETAGFPIKVLT
jgi:DNA polymerase-3 subunit epsilon